MRMGRKVAATIRGSNKDSNEQKDYFGNGGQKSIQERRFKLLELHKTADAGLCH